MASGSGSGSPAATWTVRIVPGSIRIALRNQSAKPPKRTWMDSGASPVWIRSSWRITVVAGCAGHSIAACAEIARGCCRPGRSGTPTGQDDQGDDGEPDDEDAQHQAPGIGELDERIVDVDYGTVAGDNVCVHAGARHRREEPRIELPTRARGVAVPAPPGTDDGVEVGNQRHRKHHQVCRHP